MDNRGRITVFLSLMVCSLLLLITTILKIADIRNAQAKSAMCSKTALSSIKATYNNYIFEHYHILLVDKNCSGKGQGYIEERIKENLEENLGSEYSVNEIAISNSVGIMDNEYEKFKEQIGDYMIYAVAEYGIDGLLDATGGNDGTLPDSLDDDMDNASGMTVDVNNIDTTDSDTADPVSDISTAIVKTKDPRKMVKQFLSGALLYFVLPDGMEPSVTCIDLSEVPSKGDTFEFDMGFNNGINTKFDDMDDLKGDLKKGGGWKNDLLDAGTSVTYARKVFNSAVDQYKNDNTVFDYEMEYLIAGANSDVDNLEKVVKKITALRMPINFIYLCSSTKKMNLIKTISAPLSVETLIPEAVLRYLIAGCWAYIEGVMDVRFLLHGKRLAFEKNDDNWFTDLGVLETINFEDSEDASNGLCYEDYLMILLALQKDRIYPRMLDLMELNAQQEDGGFQMESSVVSLEVDMNISYGKYDCSTNVSFSY